MDLKKFENSKPINLPLAITTVPMQPWETPYEPQLALKQGTIFPSLDLPFYVTDQLGGGVRG